MTLRKNRTLQTNPFASATSIPVFRRAPYAFVKRARVGKIVGRALPDNAYVHVLVVGSDRGSDGIDDPIGGWNPPYIGNSIPGEGCLAAGNARQVADQCFNAELGVDVEGELAFRLGYPCHRVGTSFGAERLG